MEFMARPKVYPDELRQRAVRLVTEWREAPEVSDGGFTPVSSQLGLHCETPRSWVLEAEGQDPTGGHHHQCRRRWPGPAPCHWLTSGLITLASDTELLDKLLGR